jgi:SAM-dependent methyltransferase
LGKESFISGFFHKLIAMANRKTSKRLITKQNPKKRQTIAELYRDLRTKLFIPDDYTPSRNLRSLRTKLYFDPAVVIRRRLGKLKSGQKLNVLDSGAGFLGVSADLKTQDFGQRIFLTALNPMEIKISQEMQSKIRRALVRMRTKPGKENVLKQNLIDLLEANKRLKLMDEYKTSILENFLTRKRYDIILDIFGPINFSPHSQKVVGKYFELLKPDGSLFMIANTLKIYDIKRIVENNFGPESQAAKQTGCALTMQAYGPGMYEIKKVALN